MQWKALLEPIIPWVLAEGLEIPHKALPIEGGLRFHYYVGLHGHGLGNQVFGVLR